MTEPFDPTCAAARWVSRLDGADPRTISDAAFADWLSVPGNRVLYEETRATWRDPALMESLRIARARDAAGAQQHTRRRLFIGGFAAAAATLALVVALGDTLPFAQRYSTVTAERRTYELTDGSTLELNAASSVTVDFSSARRFVRIEAGEVFFRVAHDPDRSFIVDVNGMEAIVHGTAFNIDTTAGQNYLDVYEGVVEVRVAGSPNGLAELVAGQRTVFDRGRVTPVETFDASLGVDWMSDWLEVDDAPLSRVMPKLARYLGASIVIPDEGLASRRVSGRFRLSKAAEVLASLAEIHRFNIQRTSDVVVLRSRM